MKRLLLDTNIYGLLVADADFHKLHQVIEGNRTVIKVYGLNLIRRELKEAPRRIIRGVNVQATLLRAYDSFVCKEYEVDAHLKEIAEEYFQVYLKEGGGHSPEEMRPDFLIVACASVKGIPIVVSEDNATLANELARKAYFLVNKRRKISFPIFMHYKNFKEELLRTSSNPLINSPNKFGIFLGFFKILPLIVFLFHTYPKESLIYKDFVVITHG